ncbi:MAG: peptidase [Betaproteobacteria bacterium]|nr:peptidase [Betaproteobacteria bacterium]
MSTPSSPRLQLFKLFLRAALLLLALPALVWVFSAWVLAGYDAAFVQNAQARIDAAPGLTTEARQKGREEIGAFSLTHVCESADTQGLSQAQAVRLRERACGFWGELEQFSMARRLSLMTLVFGVLALLAALGLGALAFANQEARYASFVIGWRALQAVSVVEVVAQGVLGVWLSFWLTAHFFHKYWVQLLAIAGVAAVTTIFMVLAGLFKRVPRDEPLRAEALEEAEAPALWERVRALAAAIGTAPPRQILAGIDANFFVSEAPLAIAGSQFEGRSLYVSLPLLRLLDEEEADAVLAHELAHFEGGDTRSSARLGPKITQYDHYCNAVSAAPFAFPVLLLLRLYRTIFEFAFKRESRERELIADAKACALRSPAALVNALIKVSAYGIYRGHAERALFARAERYEGAVGIAGTIGAGLADYAASPRFIGDMDASRMPHPFDSHPLLADRMAACGYHVPTQEYGVAVTRAPARTWTQAIPLAEAVEARLWASYEALFRQAHERNLAYRYRPANEQEREIVLKFFPDRPYAHGKGQTLTITYQGLQLPDGSLVAWSGLQKATIKKDRELILEHTMEKARDQPLKLRGVRSVNARGSISTVTTTIDLSLFGKQKDAFKGEFGNYWQRDQVMRKNASPG